MKKRTVALIVEFISSDDKPINVNEEILRLEMKYNEDCSKRVHLTQHLIGINDNTEPYLEDVSIDSKPRYNPDYGDDRICKCGHTYDRHFDSYENNYPCGCKYCQCYEFIEDLEIIEQWKENNKPDGCTSDCKDECTCKEVCGNHCKEDKS